MSQKKEDSFEHIPEELKRLCRWVGVTDSKIPIDLHTGEAGSSTNPDTWHDFQTAVECYQQGYIPAIGFVFNGDGLIGIDIDDGFDSEGFPTEKAIDIIRRCASYTEKSQSGRGFHILVRGQIPFKGRNNRDGVEIYSTSRFFIMTGRAMIYNQIIDNQAALNYIVKTYFQQENREKTACCFTGRYYRPVWEKVFLNGRIRTQPSYPEIPNGCRNISLTSLAGTMHNRGYNKKQIYSELLKVNQAACKPPVSRNEIQSICNSITRYER